MVEGAAPDLIQPVQVARALDSGCDLGIHPELLAANLLLRTDGQIEQRIINLSVPKRATTVDAN